MFGWGRIIINTANGSRLRSCDAHSVHGKQNKVIVAENSKLTGCRFVFKGNNNVVFIGRGCRMSKATFWISGDGNSITIGDKTTTGNNCQFATLEGTSITIGSDCMFSHDIYVRTSDSHSIVDKIGKRINKSKNIIIGDHVWIGLQSLILKGSAIPNNSVVAARSTVTRSFEDPGIILSGAPARKIKEGINWDRQKLPL